MEGEVGEHSEGKGFGKGFASDVDSLGQRILHSSSKKCYKRIAGEREVS